MARTSSATLAKLPFAHCVLGEVAEEALDQIHPGARGRGEMECEARAAVVAATPPGIAPSDPAFYLRMLMGSIVVDNEMQREVGGRLLVEVFEEGQPLPVRVTRRRLREDLPVAAQDQRPVRGSR